VIVPDGVRMTRIFLLNNAILRWASDKMYVKLRELLEKVKEMNGYENRKIKKY
jgi:hypothetical protein